MWLIACIKLSEIFYFAELPSVERWISTALRKTWSFANYASPQKYTFSASHVMPTSTSPVWGTNHSFTDEFKDHTIVEEKSCVFEMSWVLGTHWSYNIHFIRSSGVKDQEHSERSKEAGACSWTNLSMNRVWRWSSNCTNRAGSTWVMAEINQHAAEWP